MLPSQSSHPQPTQDEKNHQNDKPIDKSTSVPLSKFTDFELDREYKWASKGDKKNALSEACLTEIRRREEVAFRKAQPAQV